MNLAEIPHEDSLAFEGELPERVRHLFREGDPAEIRLNRDPDRVLRGRLASISPFSRDADEENETGVKVLDLVIELDDPPPDVAFGIYGWAVIRAAEPRT
ncbi:MAG: HlyD family efflux transporter periplasmic adaptor subunit, partial [Halospina sp.]